MKNIYINNLGDLIEIQRSSFYKFLFSGITEEILILKNPFISSIYSKNNIITTLIYFYSNQIKLVGPTSTINDCIDLNLNYTINIYIPCEYYLPILKRIPLSINKEYTFLKRNFLSFFKKSYKQFLVREDFLLCEIPLMTEEGTFLLNGCERIIISQIIRSPGIYFSKEFIPLTFKTDCIATLISNEGLWSKFTLKTNDHNIDNIYIKFTDINSNVTTDLFNLEKININDLFTYFNLNINEILDFLQKYTASYKLELFLSKLKYKLKKIFIKCIHNKFKEYFSLGKIGRYKLNQRLKSNLPLDITFLTSHDLLNIIKELIKVKYYIGIPDNIDDIKNKIVRSIGELLQHQIHTGLNLLKKIIKDKFKPLITDFNKESNEAIFINSTLLTKFIRDFFITSQLSQFMDQTNPLAELTHKRKISIFGPNGLKNDNINVTIRDIHPSQYSRLCPIETPEGANAGLISALALFGRISSLGFLETPYFYLNKNIIYSNKQPIFLNSEQEFNSIIAFSDFSCKNQTKISKKLISIKEKNVILLKKLQDINFLTISPSQIISIATSLIPFVEHNDSNRALMGSNMQRQSISLLYTQTPIIGTGLESIIILDSDMVIKTYSEGIVSFSSSVLIQILDNLNQKITYYLKKYTISNQKTSLNQIPIVWSGEKVFSNQIIADGPSTKEGELSLGKNLIIAYMPWEGYNYEDAIIINENILYNNLFTSIHIEECEIDIFSTEYFSVNTLLDSFNKENIINIGSYVKSNDLLLNKTLLEIEILPNKKKKRKKLVHTSTSFYVPTHIEGRIIDIKIEKRNIIHKQETVICNTIRFYIAQIRKLEIGDKLSGRHGNKGIITRILPNQDMPYLPDGIPIDIILNPLGVPSRMNVGQVFESLLGLAGSKLGKRFNIFPFDEIYGKEASRVLINNKLKEAAIKTKKNWLFNKYYVGKVLIQDGRTGEYFDNPVLIGKSYIIKLIHLVDDKLQARSIGPYSSITEQPTGGKALHGGQRFGEMEVWALEAYGCSNTLQEFLTIKSDDINSRKQISSFISGIQNEIKTSMSESFLALISELNSLGLAFTLYNLNSNTKYPQNIKKTTNNIFKELENYLKLKSI